MPVFGVAERLFERETPPVQGYDVGRRLLVLERLLGAVVERDGDMRAANNSAR
jgi:hypothetical protein